MPDFEQLLIGRVGLGHAAAWTPGNCSRRIAEAVDQSQLCLIERALVPASDTAPGVRDTFRDVLVAGLIEEAVDFERSSVQVEFLDVVQSFTRGILKNVTD